MTHAHSLRSRRIIVLTPPRKDLNRYGMVGFKHIATIDPHVSIEDISMHHPVPHSMLTA